MVKKDKSKKSSASFFERVDIAIISGTTAFVTIIAWITAFLYGQNNPYVIGGSYSFWDFANFWTAFAYSNWIVYLLIWAGIGFLFSMLIVVLMNYFRR